MLLNNYSWVQMFCTTTTWNFQKLLSYRFYGGNVVRVPVQFFSLPLIFTLHWWPLAFLILSLPLQNFHVVPPTKKCFLCFLSLALNPCRPFSRWASLACRPLSLFLCFFFCSIFQICRLDTLSKLNTLKYTDTETISTFRFHLYWLFCCLCFTRHRWLCDFPPK